MKSRMHAARAGASVVLMLSTMIACSGASPDPADADVPSTGTERVGSVYADLQVEYLAAGERVYRSMYDEVGRACRELGIGTQLPDEYVEKLGTSRLQVWSTHDRVAVRNEVYTYVAGPVEEGRHCDFEPATRGMHLYRDANETATWDLATGVESKAPPRPEYEWKRTAVATAPAATNPGTHERSASGGPVHRIRTVGGRRRAVLHLVGRRRLWLRHAGQRGEQRDGQRSQHARRTGHRPEPDRQRKWPARDAVGLGAGRRRAVRDDAPPCTDAGHACRRASSMKRRH